MRLGPVARDVEGLQAGETTKLRRKLPQMVASAIENQKAAHVADGCRERLAKSNQRKEREQRDAHWQHTVSELFCKLHSCAAGKKDSCIMAGGRLARQLFPNSIILNCLHSLLVSKFEAEI